MSNSAEWTPESSRARPGLVSLVGAGPGDPELLTARAHTRLAEADVVLYDALVSPAVLALARHARCLSVGKRHGRHSVSQDTINRLLVRGAKRNQRLVRLKAGDPYVFGRGGEEALALAAAGLPFEVVPGVSSAIAAPALAGIPVTHRGLASGVLVVSGHAESSYAPAIDSLAPKGTTLVVLMGVNTRAQIAGAWSPAAGRTPPRPRSSSPRRRPTRARGSAPSATSSPARRCKLPETPGTLVVGDVVSLAAALAPASGALQVTDPPTTSRRRATSTTGSMAAIDDPKTLGRARLSFATEGDVDEFVHAGEVRAGRPTPTNGVTFRLLRGTYGSGRTACR